MAYDVEGARRAGATDDQIIQYLTQTRKFDVQGALNAGATKQQVIDYLSITSTKSQPAQETTTVPQKGFLQKATDVVGSIFPGRKVGEAIGTLAGYGYTRAKDLVKGTNYAQQYDLSGPSVKEVAGDVVAGAATVAGLKAPLPITAKGGVSALKTAAQFAGLSSAAAAGESAKDGSDTRTIAKDAFVSGLVGGAAGGVVGGALKTAQKLKDIAPESIYNNALRVTQRIKQAGKSPSSFLADKGIWGNLGTFKRVSEEGIETSTQIINQKLAKASGGIAKAEIVDDAVKILAKKYGKNYSTAQLKQLIDDVPLSAFDEAGGSLDYVGSNQVRQGIDSLLGDNFFLSQAQKPLTKEAYKAVADVLRTKIKSATGASSEFAELSKWIQTKKAVDRAIDIADSKFGVGLYDVVSGGVGAAGGLASGDSITDRLKNAVIYGGTGVALERVARSPAVQTGIAQLIKKLPVDSAGKVSRSAVEKLLAQIVGGN